MSNSISVQPKLSEYERISTYVDAALEKRGISSGSPTFVHTHIVLDEVFSKIVDFASVSGNRFSEDISIEFNHSFIGNGIIFKFRGNRFNLWETDDLSTKVLNEYRDKLSTKFKDGINEVEIVLTSGLDSRTMFNSFASILIGFVIGLIDANFGNEASHMVVEGFMTFGEELFTKAMALISAPITFFSIVVLVARYCTISSHDNRMHIKSVFRSTVFSSVICLVIGTLFALLLMNFDLRITRDIVSKEVQLSNATITDMLTSFVPDNIFDPFLSLNVIPLIFTAVVLGIAVGRTTANNIVAMQIAETLFSVLANMQALIYLALPFVLFFSAIDIGLSIGMWAFPLAVILGAIFFGGIFMVCVAYLLILKIRGGDPKQFMKRTKRTIAEGYKIGSSLDAIPTMTRCLRSNFDLEWDYLKDVVPFCTNIIMDASCVVISSLTMILVMQIGTQLTVLQYAALFFIIISLSVGAPNQPGTVVICMNVIFAYLGYDPIQYYCLFIMCEAILSKYMGASNVFGVLVTVYTEKLSAERKRKKAAVQEPEEAEKPDPDETFRTEGTVQFEEEPEKHYIDFDKLEEGADIEDVWNMLDLEALDRDEKKGGIGMVLFEEVEETGDDPDGNTPV